MSSFVRNETSNFRQRGYVFADVGVTVLVFGNDPAPTTFPGSSVEPTLLWDNDVIQVITVSKHVEGDV